MIVRVAWLAGQGSFWGKQAILTDAVDGQYKRSWPLTGPISWSPTASFSLSITSFTFTPVCKREGCT